VTEKDIADAGALIGTPDTFVEDVEWSEKIITE
jgi:hypothetical protein